MTDLHEPTIRACIEALDDNEQHYARDTLLALLPKPVDPAEQLVEEFELEHNVSPQGMCHEIRIEVARWMLARQPDPVARKEWSEEEISDVAEEEVPDFCNEMVTPLHEAREDRIRNRVNVILRHGIEMGRQLAPVPANSQAPLTHDEIVKEAREWCGRTDPSYPWHTGEYDELPQMRHTIAILTAWKGEK